MMLPSGSVLAHTHAPVHNHIELEIISNQKSSPLTTLALVLSAQIPAKMTVFEHIVNAAPSAAQCVLHTRIRSRVSERGLQHQ